MFTTIQIDLLSAAHPAREHFVREVRHQRADLAARSPERETRSRCSTAPAAGWLARETAPATPSGDSSPLTSGIVLLVSCVGALPSAARLHNSIRSVSAGSGVGRRLMIDAPAVRGDPVAKDGVVAARDAGLRSICDGDSPQMSQPELVEHANVAAKALRSRCASVGGSFARK